MTIPNGSAGNYGPFRPGPGGLPPCLAGREEEQALFRRRLDELRRGIPPPAEIVLYGPRGNGKTALLFWLEELVKERAGVDVVRLAPSFFDGPTGLTRAIRHRARWRVPIPKGVFFRRPEAPASRSLEEALAARVSGKPLILLIDEAHRLGADTGRLLLDASRQAGRRLPFLLALAGTPDLEGRLSASSRNRADRRRIGRLSEAATTAAFSGPFESEGVALTPDASADLVRVSHGYPFFIQLLGGLVWGSWRPGPRRPTNGLPRAKSKRRSRVSASANASISPWKKRPALHSSTRGRQVRVRFRGEALFPRAGGANRCAIPPAIVRGEGATPSPHPSPVGASRRRGLSGLSPRAAITSTATGSWGGGESWPRRGQWPPDSRRDAPS